LLIDWQWTGNDDANIQQKRKEKRERERERLQQFHVKLLSRKKTEETKLKEMIRLTN
jgi:hypothetical protein